MKQNNIDNLQVDTAGLLNALMHMAEALLNSGAEVYRTEDTLNRIALAYGAEDIEIFAITSSIVGTIRMPGEKSVTQTRRIKMSGGNDFEKLERLNELSRAVCRCPIEVDALGKAIDEISLKPQKDVMLLLGSMLASGCFAVFYGGSLSDGILSVLIGVVIFIMQKYLAPICMNKLTFQFCASFLAGLLACVAVRLIPGSLLDKIVIGDIMLLVPGLMFTNAVRDMLLGDTLSGILRLIEALLLAALMTMGFLAAILLMNHIWCIG